MGGAMENDKSIPWTKLHKDIVRYKQNFSLTSSAQLMVTITFWPVFLLRLEEYEQLSTGLIKKILRFFLLFFRVFVRCASGIEIYYGAKIGGGLLLPGLSGVGITDTAIIGENCTIHSCVRVGHRGDGKDLGAPVIGDNVTLMLGSKIIGPIKIGDNAVVGANAVVLQDVPASAIAVGVPAVIKMKRAN